MGRLTTLAFVLASACISNNDLPCSTTQTSPSLPGLEVTFDTPSCTMQSGSGGILNYEITVGSALSFTTGPHAGCMPTMSDPRSFTTVEVTGAGGEYCPTCDIGTCPEDPGEAIMIPAGPYTNTFNFLARSWDGPSDTGVQPGGPLPAGAYTGKLVITMPMGTLEADLAITLD